MTALGASTVIDMTRVLIADLTGAREDVNVTR